MMRSVFVVLLLVMTVKSVWDVTWPQLFACCNSFNTDRCNVVSVTSNLAFRTYHYTLPEIISDKYLIQGKLHRLESMLK